MARRHEEKYRSVLGNLKSRFGKKTAGDLERYIRRENIFVDKALTAPYDDQKVKGLEKCITNFAEGLIHTAHRFRDPSDIHALADKYGHLFDAGMEIRYSGIGFSSDSSGTHNEVYLTIRSNTDQFDMLIDSYSFALYSGLAQPIDWLDIEFSKYTRRKRVNNNGHGPFLEKERRMLRIKINL